MNCLTLLVAPPVMAFSGGQKNATQRREADSAETAAKSNFCRSIAI